MFVQRAAVASGVHGLCCREVVRVLDQIDLLLRHDTA